MQYEREDWTKPGTIAYISGSTLTRGTDILRLEMRHKKLVGNWNKFFICVACHVINAMYLSKRLYSLWKIIVHTKTNSFCTGN